MSDQRPSTKPVNYGAILLGVIVLWVCVLFGPWRMHGIRHVPSSPLMQTSHALGLAMYSYQNDNDGRYPTGKSSTEVFQQLLDGGYVTDPLLFYIRMAGKVKPVPGQKLRPDNVCWDVTADVTTRSPTALPLVFSTGYKVIYAPGADALPLLKPYPEYWHAPRTFMQWWNNWPPAASNDPGIAVFYVNNSARFISFSITTASGGSIPHFVPPDFVPDGRTYRQLTPDGVLPP